MVTYTNLQTRKVSFPHSGCQCDYNFTSIMTLGLPVVSSNCFFPVLHAVNRCSNISRLFITKSRISICSGFPSQIIHDWIIIYINHKPTFAHMHTILKVSRRFERVPEILWCYPYLTSTLVVVYVVYSVQLYALYTSLKSYQMASIWCRWNDSQLLIYDLWFIK